MAFLRLFGTAVGIALVTSWSAALGAGATPAANAPQTVYTNDFSRDPGPEWSRRTTDVAPKGNRRFLGQFGRESITLALQNLPAHAYVRISADLFIIRTWDGNVDIAHLDTWELSVRGGPRLVRATFGGGPEIPDGQSYPDEIMGPGHPGGTGSSEWRTLGFDWVYMGDRAKGLPPQRHESVDSVYRISAVFPHQDRAVAFGFGALLGQGMEDESWGLDNVKVEVLPGPPNKDADGKQLDAWWKDLTGADAVKANAAKWALVGVGEKVVPFIAERMNEGTKGPAQPADRVATIRQLIADLDSDSWAVRERASAELKKIVVEAEPLLRETLATTKSAEVKWRVEDILSKKPARVPGPGGVSSEPPMVSRVRRILEVIGTDEAKRALATLPPAPVAPAPTMY